jgi:hypothetical protein
MMPPVVPLTTDQLAKLSQLLQDAHLADGSFAEDAATMKLVLHCLRREGDGADLSEQPLRLELTGVSAMAVVHDPLWPHDRPSALEVPSESDVVGLDPWPFVDDVVSATKNSATDAETVELGAWVRWFLGDQKVGLACPIRLCLEFPPAGEPEQRRLVWIACESVGVFEGEKAFDFDRWLGQSEAWWRYWDARWKEKDEQREEAPRRGKGDSMIPVPPTEAPDLSYRPPDWPAFELSSTDAPQELLDPLRDWFESVLERDWARRAASEPELDRTRDEQVVSTKRRFENQEFGRFGYARSIDEWWVEGDRAFVRVHGTEHRMPVGDLPAEDLSSVWEFALRRRGGRWCVAGYSQGW